MSLAQQAHELILREKRDWAMLRENHARLAQSQFRTFAFDGFEITAQFNPGRMFSAIAKLDARSIAGRPCALCDANRPAEQSQLDAGDGYWLMCNPHPILPEHFTLVQREHAPQRIGPHFGKLLELARQLGERYTVFYNGPECGASSPDHMHFQAATRDQLAIDREYDRIKQRVGERDEVGVFAGLNYLRYFIGLESSDATKLAAAFARLYEAYAKLTPQNLEPMMNVLCGYRHGVWRTTLFPRSKHRPSCYFATDVDQMLLSPGTVDIGGLVIMVREQDFLRLTHQHLVQMYQEITVDRATVVALTAAAL